MLIFSSWTAHGPPLLWTSSKTLTSLRSLYYGDLLSPDYSHFSSEPLITERFRNRFSPAATRALCDQVAGLIFSPETGPPGVSAPPDKEYSMFPQKRHRHDSLTFMEQQSSGHRVNCSAYSSVIALIASAAIGGTSPWAPMTIHSLGTFYKTLYGEAFAVGPDGTHLEGSVTIESLRENLARCHSLGLLLRLTAYFERSKRALARLAAYEELRVRPPRAFSFTRECLLRAAVKILPNALTRADKGFLAQAKALVSRIAFGSVEFGLFGPIGLREPQEEVRVWLCGLGSPRDVTYRNVIANSKPHTIGFGLDGESQKIDTGTRLELKFEERTGERRLLAEIDLTCRDSIDLTDGQIALFQSAKCRNFCLPRTLLWRQYLRWAYHRWRTRDRDDPDHRLSTREVHAMFAFYICPRPVFLVSVADGDTSNLFPMDLLGIVGAEHFSLTLKSTSTAVPLLRQARRAALVSVPIEQTDLVYGLGPNHRKQDFVWDKTPFGVRTSPAFGLPVPDFSLRVRDMEVTDIRELGSHQFFICRIVEDRRFVDGDEFFESHSFYQAWKHRQRGSTPEPS